MIPNRYQLSLKPRLQVKSAAILDAVAMSNEGLFKAPVSNTMFRSTKSFLYHL